VKRTVLPLVTLAASLLGAAVAQSSSRRQTSFCDDDAPDNLRLKASPLPRAVLTALANTKEAREVQREAKNKGSSFNIATLFRGAEVTLADDPDKMFLVIGKEPMAGADNTWFWIVRQSGDKAEILLWAGANCLNIEKSSKLGFRDIQTEWSSASYSITEAYSFNGTTYKLTKRKSHAVN
jgi:hypothetical protein